MHYRFSEYITPSERLAAMRLGGIRKLASMGVTPDEFEKRADDGLLSSAIKLSLYLGIPLGIATYAAQSSIGGGGGISRSNRKRKAALDKYNDIVNDYELERMSGEEGLV